MSRVARWMNKGTNCIRFKVTGIWLAHLLWGRQLLLNQNMYRANLNYWWKQNLVATNGKSKWQQILPLSGVPSSPSIDSNGQRQVGQLCFLLWFWFDNWIDHWTKLAWHLAGTNITTKSKTFSVCQVPMHVGDYKLVFAVGLFVLVSLLYHKTFDAPLMEGCSSQMAVSKDVLRA